ncbi:hypothetical protein SprV_0401564500 [Sparganum proliferum]
MPTRLAPRTQRETPPRVRHALPYITDVSEAPGHIAAGLGVGIAHQPKATMHSRVMKVKLNVCLGYVYTNVDWLCDGMADYHTWMPTPEAREANN